MTSPIGSPKAATCHARTDHPETQRHASPSQSLAAPGRGPQSIPWVRTGSGSNSRDSIGTGGTHSIEQQKELEKSKHHHSLETKFLSPIKVDVDHPAKFQKQTETHRLLIPEIGRCYVSA